MGNTGNPLKPAGELKEGCAIHQDLGREGQQNQSAQSLAFLAMEPKGFLRHSSFFGSAAGLA